MAPLKSVLLVGATGNAGAPILAALTADQTFKVSVLTRASSTSTFPPSVTIHKVSDDYPLPDLIAAFQGQDAVISTISRLSIETQKRMIDAAVQAGVKRFIPSEFGGDPDNEKTAALLPEFTEGKKPVLDYLKGKAQEGRITWTGIATGPFWDMAVSTGFMGFSPTSHSATICRPGTMKWATTRLATIGLAVKNTLLLPEKTANRYLYIASFMASYDEIIAAFEKAQGVKWQVEYVDPEEQRALGRKKMDEGKEYEAALLLLRYMVSQEGYGGDYPTYRENGNEILGLPKETLEGVVKDSVKG